MLSRNEMTTNKGNLLTEAYMSDMEDIPSETNIHLKDFNVDDTLNDDGIVEDNLL